MNDYLRKEIEKDKEETEKAKLRLHMLLHELVCPDCSNELTDERIKEGRYKGHGRIICKTCKEVKVMI